MGNWAYTEVTINVQTAVFFQTRVGTAVGLLYGVTD